MNNNKSNIGLRMKENYEKRHDHYLTKRIPVIIRVDGRAFHTFTKHFMKPFDTVFLNSMITTAYEMFKNIAGCKFAYVYSDEISFLLTDYEKLTTDSYFDYRINKVVSITASEATLLFNNIFSKSVENFHNTTIDSIDNSDEKNIERYNNYSRKLYTATFDSRAFNIPESEVCNYFIWRQQDCIRSSINSYGQKYFSQKMLNKLNRQDILELLEKEKNIIWENELNHIKYGTCIYRTPSDTIIYSQGENKDIIKNILKIDYDTPVFTKNRNYIERHLGIADNH